MNLYTRWIRNWEEELAEKDRQRRTLSFNWGLEWLDLEVNGGDPLSALKSWANSRLRDRESWLRLTDPVPCEWEGSRLRFETPAPGPYPANNMGEARVWRPRRGRAGNSRQHSAVIVVPQWNADSRSHAGLCQMLARLGLTAVRLTLPYHEVRNPEGIRRADLMVSPDLGRTLHAVRQAVLEVQVLAAWLRAQGFTRIGVMGTSLGSCIAYLSFCTDQQLAAGVFNHVSSHFGDVVWSGSATRFIRRGLEDEVTRADLRECWGPISPWHYIDRRNRLDRPHLMITADFDTTFIPELAELVFQRYREHGLSVERVRLPCGHYTMAHPPFVYLDGWHICRYLTRHLS